MVKKKQTVAFDPDQFLNEMRDDMDSYGDIGGQVEAMSGMLQGLSNIFGNCITNAVEITKLIHGNSGDTIKEADVLRTLEKTVTLLVQRTPVQNLMGLLPGME